MKNSEIRDRLKLLVSEERRVKAELIEIMSLALVQKSWLEFGYSSLFDSPRLPKWNRPDQSGEQGKCCKSTKESAPFAIRAPA